MKDIINHLQRGKIEPNGYDHWLVGWVLWHINLYRLFNAKSIFTQMISSISNNSV